MSEEKNIKLELSLDDINKILKALGSQPFVEVYELIGEINKQANNHFSKENQSKDSNSFTIN